MRYRFVPGDGNVDLVTHETKCGQGIKSNKLGWRLKSDTDVHIKF